MYALVGLQWYLSLIRSVNLLNKLNFTFWVESPPSVFSIPNCV
jgi:hypothetical protein